MKIFHSMMRSLIICSALISCAVATISAHAASSASTFQYSASAYNTTYNAGTVVVTIERLGSSVGAVRVGVNTHAGTALNGLDFDTVNQWVNWANGDSAPKTVSIPILNRGSFSGTRSFSLGLSGESAGTALGSPATAEVNISGGAAKTTTNLSVTSPSGGATVSGTVQIKGFAGSAWVNVRAYANGAPVGADTAPSGGSFTLSVNTASLPNGPTTILVIAFSVPPGNPAGIAYTQAQVSLPLTINNQAAVNGACGSSNGTTLAQIPTTNLCSAGTASSVAGSGPWTWSCAGANGGKQASCQALLAHNTNSCSITSFGAVGNGVTNNAAAIQTAFNYAAANKCTALIPAGNYAYSGTLTANGIAITGIAGQSQLTPLDVANEALIITGTGGSVSNLTMVSRATARLSTPQSAMIWASNAGNYTIQNVLINGSSSVGIFSLTSTSGLITNNTVKNTLADSISQILGSYNDTVTNNRVLNSGDDGISNVSYAGNPIVHDITIQGNTIINNAHARGISIVGGNNITIMGNYVEESTDNYSDIYIASEGEYNTLGVNTATVSGNTLIDGGPNQGTITIYNSQGTTYSISGVTISGNQIVTPKFVPVQYVGNGHESGVVENNTAYTSSTFTESGNSLEAFSETNNKILAPVANVTPIVTPGGGCNFAGCQ